MEAVRRIESFVARYIDNKSMSVGYASAVEVVESRQGDCSEFAVLTAALCRAVGIPAQVVVGIAYVKEFAGIPILSPRDFWKLLQKRGPDRKHRSRERGSGRRRPRSRDPRGSPFPSRRELSAGRTGGRCGGPGDGEREVVEDLPIVHALPSRRVEGNAFHRIQLPRSADSLPIR